MFTGLIETTQKLTQNTPAAAGRRLLLPLGTLSEDAKPGDSICVNGVCLTISDIQSQSSQTQAFFDVMAETAKKSTLAQLKPGQIVNLERAMPAQGRFGGHFVQGHVDGTAQIKSIQKTGPNSHISLAADKDLTRYMIPKGSIAMDGISLTLITVSENEFSLGVIPTTWKKTNLAHRKRGDRVNIELDLLGKWIVTYLDSTIGSNKQNSQITLETLRKQGLA